MMTKTIPFLRFTAAAAAATVLFCMSTGCESSGGKDGGGGDEVSFSKLEFRYGGADYSGITNREGVTIKNLRVGANSWSFEFETDMTAWGYGDGHLERLCAFMKTRDGKWIGGQMHWQGNTKPHNDFHNVYHPGYIGFYDVFNHINNPCEIAFVLIDTKGKRRSNVIKSTWSWNESRRQ